MHSAYEYYIQTIQLYMKSELDSQKDATPRISVYDKLPARIPLVRGADCEKFRC